MIQFPTVEKIAEKRRTGCIYPNGETLAAVRRTGAGRAGVPGRDWKMANKAGVDMADTHPADGRRDENGEAKDAHPAFRSLESRPFEHQLAQIESFGAIKAHNRGVLKQRQGSNSSWDSGTFRSNGSSGYVANNNNNNNFFSNNASNYNNYNWNLKGVDYNVNDDGAINNYPFHKSSNNINNANNGNSINSNTAANYKNKNRRNQPQNFVHMNGPNINYNGGGGGSSTNNYSNQKRYKVFSTYPNQQAADPQSMDNQNIYPNLNAPVNMLQHLQKQQQQQQRQKQQSVQSTQPTNLLESFLFQQLSHQSQSSGLSTPDAYSHLQNPFSTFNLGTTNTLNSTLLNTEYDLNSAAGNSDIFGSRLTFPDLSNEMVNPSSLLPMFSSATSSAIIPKSMSSDVSNPTMGGGNASMLGNMNMNMNMNMNIDMDTARNMEMDANQNLNSKMVNTSSLAGYNIKHSSNPNKSAEPSVHTSINTSTGTFPFEQVQSRLSKLDTFPSVNVQSVTDQTDAMSVSTPVGSGAHPNSSHVSLGSSVPSNSTNRENSLTIMPDLLDNSSTTICTNISNNNSTSVLTTATTKTSPTLVDPLESIWKRTQNSNSTLMDGSDFGSTDDDGKKSSIDFLSLGFASGNLDDASKLKETGLFGTYFS